MTSDEYNEYDECDDVSHNFENINNSINDCCINDCLNKNKDKVIHSLIKKIHPEINIYYNSVNIFVGKQGSGKTLSCLEEIIKISQIKNASHMLVYVTRYGDKTDITFESLKELIQIPIVYISQDNAEEYINNLLDYKQLYYEVRNNNLMNDIIDEQKEQIFETLHIDNFESDMLHTLILLEDIANNKLLKHDTSYFSHLLTTCRHNHITFFLNVQFWKSLSSTIKSNVSTVYVFGTFSRQQLSYILYQIPISVNFNELYKEYQKLSKNNKMIIDCNNGLFKIV